MSEDTPTPPDATPVWEVPATPPAHPVWEVPRPGAAGAAGPDSEQGGGGHPEIAVGLAFVGGLASAIILKRLAS
jgi:hypothetical protein